ncbi:MAG: hypothetical protein J1E42_08095 [Akkermansiaceae bacterium]|nr:hypothetical protein [Akkermansiaceae bacterium]
MLHQSKVRKTALCLIYAILEQNCTEQDFPYRHFWEITLEKDYDHLRQALCKGILHACRSAKEVAGVFVERGEAFLLETQGDFTLVPQREIVESCVERTKATLTALTDLRLCLNDKRRDGSAPLEERCRKVLQLAQTICRLSEDLFSRLADAPEMRPSPEGVAGAMRRWLRVLGECTPLEHPETLADSEEYAGLARKALDLAALRPAAEQLAREVVARRDALEADLERLLRNYVPERLDVVDKSILYLSLYELQCRKLSIPIVISEANNLAHEFSGSKSAPFIHGVLAAAALEQADNS